MQGSTCWPGWPVWKARPYLCGSATTAYSAVPSFAPTGAVASAAARGHGSSVGFLVPGCRRFTISPRTGCCQTSRVGRINSYVDLDQLRSVIDYLMTNRIPFSIGHVHLQIRLRERPRICAAGGSARRYAARARSSSCTVTRTSGPATVEWWFSSGCACASSGRNAGRSDAGVEWLMQNNNQIYPTISRPPAIRSYNSHIVADVSVCLGTPGSTLFYSLPCDRDQPLDLRSGYVLLSAEGNDARIMLVCARNGSWCGAAMPPRFFILRFDLNEPKTGRRPPGDRLFVRVPRSTARLCTRPWPRHGCRRDQLDRRRSRYRTP